MVFEEELFSKFGRYGKFGLLDRRFGKFVQVNDIDSIEYRNIMKKYKEEYENTNIMFKTKFIGNSALSGRYAKGIWCEKLFILHRPGVRNDKVYYVDFAKQSTRETQQGKKHYWNWHGMNIYKFIEEINIHQIRETEIFGKKKGYYVVLKCENLGFFIFESREMLEHLRHGKVGEINKSVLFNVIVKDGGNKICLVIDRDYKIGIADKRNIFDSLE